MTPKPSLKEDDKIQLGKFTHDFDSMIAIIFWNSLGFFFLEFLVPYVAKTEMKATGVQIGSLVSVQTLGYAICSIFVGFIVDKHSKKRLVLLGAFGRGTAYFILFIGILMRNIVIVGLGTFSIGFGVGFFWIPLDALIAEKSNKENRSYAYGKRHSAIGKGMLAGSILGFALFLFFSDHTPNNDFLIYLPIILFGLANYWGGFKFWRNVDENIKFNDKSREHVHSQIDSSLELKESEKKNQVSREMIMGIVFLLIVLFLAAFNTMVYRPFVQVYLLENFTTDPNVALMAYIPSGMFGMLVAPKLGEWADKIPPKYGITLFSILGAIVTLLLVNTNNIVVFAFLLLLDNSIANIAGLTVQNLLSRISEAHRGKIMAIRSVSSNIGEVAAPLVGGWAWDEKGPRSPFLLSIGLELCLIPFYILSIKKITPHLEEKIIIELEIPEESVF